jgi:hypothetical protein
MPDRHVLLLDLVDDAGAIARYEAWHAAGALPLAIGRSIRAAGIEAMDIYRAGTRLVMVMETGPDFDPVTKAAADAADPGRCGGGAAQRQQRRQRDARSLHPHSPCASGPCRLAG